MKTTNDTVPMEQEEEAVYKPNFIKTELPGFMGLAGQPVYIISDPLDIDAIDEITDSPVYYVLGKLKEKKFRKETKNKKQVQTSYDTESLTLMKRIRNNSGAGLVPVEDPGTVPLGTVRTWARSDLPKIPRDLMDYIILFFRRVYEELGSEAIVVLGYDFDYLHTEPADGWVVFVPKQTNSAASCDYEPESIMEDRANYPNASIVGTIHSHPMMEAFASATDIKDQRDNDGLHITVGWKDDYRVDYHCEYQIGNVRFSYDPEDVIEMLSIEEDEDLSAWMGQVKKRAITPTKTTLYNKNTGSSKKKPQSTWKKNTQTSSTTSKETKKVDSEVGSKAKKLINQVKPQSIPDIEENLVIFLVKDETECIICDGDIVEAKASRRCTHCLTYLLYPEDNMDLMSIVEQRKPLEGEVFAPGLEFLFIDGKKPEQDILGVYHAKHGIATRAIYLKSIERFIGRNPGEDNLKKTVSKS